jgi:hypothetical protein
VACGVVWIAACATGGPAAGMRQIAFGSTRGPNSSSFLFCRMPAPEHEGQFDDAPIDKLPEDVRQQYNYIDDTPPEHSDGTSEGDDDFDSEELDDDFARVEDEDWEIAERGGCSNPTLKFLSLF